MYARADSFTDDSSQSGYDLASVNNSDDCAQYMSSHDSMPSLRTVSTIEDSALYSSYMDHPSSPTCVTRMFQHESPPSLTNILRMEQLRQRFEIPFDSDELDHRLENTPSDFEYSESAEPDSDF